MKKLDTTLYFITDSTGFAEDEFLRRVEEALAGGTTILQLREKKPETPHILSPSGACGSAAQAAVLSKEDLR